MQNYFETLNDALDAECLLDVWPITTTIGYGQTIGMARNGRWLSVYRDENGRYERPIHYETLMADTCAIHLS